LLWNHKSPVAPPQTLDFARLDVARIKTRDALVHVDKTSGALTITFRYAKGEPEARIPVAALGLPSDWRSWKALVFDYSATSLEAFQFAFSNGEASQGQLIEPLPAFAPGSHSRRPSPKPHNTPVCLSLPRPGPSDCSHLNALPKCPPHALPQFGLATHHFHRESGSRRATGCRRPVIDKYGQWIPENWPGKAHSADELRALWSADVIPKANFPFCPLGGMASRQLRATGFFRTEQVDGKWVFIDPHGHPFYSAGMVWSAKMASAMRTNSIRGSQLEG